MLVTSEKPNTDFPAVHSPVVRGKASETVALEPSLDETCSLDFPDPSDTERVAERTEKVAESGEKTIAHGDHDRDGAMLIASPHLPPCDTGVNADPHTLLCEIEGHGSNNVVAKLSRNLGILSTAMADNGALVALEVEHTHLSGTESAAIDYYRTFVESLCVEVTANFYR